MHVLSGWPGWKQLAIARLLWKRAAASRKNLRGIEQGIEKRTTKLDSYDAGILRAIFVDGITTQKHLWNMKHSQHPICTFCWEHEESILHMFWDCPKWQDVRLRHLSASQLIRSQQLPSCTRRTGLFLNTAEQHA